MPLDLPNKELLAVITAAATAAGCVDVNRAVAVAVEAATKGEFNSAEQVDSWYALQRIQQPNLFSASTDGPADHAEHADLMLAAFQDRSPDARAKLIAAIGSDAANAAAKAWQLTGIHDYAKAGTKPNGADHAAAKEKGEKNPFAPNWKGADRNRAIADFIVKFGTASASRMAASAGADIAGRPLKVRAA